MAHELVEVPAGGHVSYSLGDGEVLENKLIDITATGATFSINAFFGSNTVIRNIGIRGEWDDLNKVEPIIDGEQDPNGESLIENVYFADGDAGRETYPGCTGLFIGRGHAGTMTIRRMNVQDMSDNGIRGDTPGNSDEGVRPEGGGGVVQIEDCYTARCQPAGFRLGTFESYIKNCVGWRNQRNHWQFFQHSELIDSDITGASEYPYGGSIGDIALGDNVWVASDEASVTCTNTVWETEAAHGGATTDNIIGTPAARTPRTQPEECRVPLTPLDAAEGNFNEPGPGPSPEPPAESSRMVVLTPTGAPLTSYTFDIEGTAVPLLDDPEHPAESSNDNVVDNGDGTMSATGQTGNGQGDAWEIAGTVLSFTSDNPVTIVVDGTEYMIGDLIGTTFPVAEPPPDDEPPGEEPPPDDEPPGEEPTGGGGRFRRVALASGASGLALWVIDTLRRS